jgi:hypothetical protein
MSNAFDLYTGRSILSSSARARRPRAARGAAGPCGVCGAAAPATPFAALPCLHPHCYYCLASACAGDGGHACWCGARVAAMVRVRREA